MVIEFFNIQGTMLGRVTQDEQGTLHGSTDLAELMIQDYVQDGYTAQDFIDHYSDWTSGYLRSELVTE